jgi:hypothetical protein
MASYAGAAAFFALEAVTREPGEASDLAVTEADQGTTGLIVAAHGLAARMTFQNVGKPASMRVLTTLLPAVLTRSDLKSVTGGEQSRSADVWRDRAERRLGARRVLPGGVLDGAQNRQLCAVFAVAASACLVGTACPPRHLVGDGISARAWGPSRSESGSWRMALESRPRSAPRTQERAEIRRVISRCR